MKTILTVAAAIAACGLASTSATAVQTGQVPMSYEEFMAHQEEAHIITAPIAGVVNHYWFDYQVNIVEAKKELASDMRHAHKIAAERRAWDEYGHELKHERFHYVKEMKKRGYPVGEVYLVD